MGRGRNRKARNFATFRLCPRPGAADASDRVFVRVDDNPYSVPGFADEDGHGHGVEPSSSGYSAGDSDALSSSLAGDGGDALPDHARREILELGLPDDGYDYLAHLREIRPSLSSTGGGASAVFLPSRRPARSGPPPDVKAYDLSGVMFGSAGGAETEVVVTRVEEATDLDVAKQLEESDLLAAGMEDEDLEDDFVIVANQPEEDEDGERLPHEHFHSLALEEHTEGKDKQIFETSNAIPDHAECVVRYSATTVSSLNPDIQPGKILTPENVKNKHPKFPPGETSMKRIIIKKGIEKLPAEYLPQKGTSSGDTSKQGSYMETRKETRKP